MEVEYFESFQSVPGSDWDSLVSNDSVFQEYRFLYGLEKCGCIGKSDWKPLVFLCREGGRVVGGLSCYIRFNSYGEFIFDFQWANAFQRAGISYYPKISIASPFTPVTGERILFAKFLSVDQKREVSRNLLGALIQHGKERKISSLHALFCLPVEREYFSQMNFAERVSHQYHWKNRDFGSFEEFLDTLVKDRRKMIRQERKKVQMEGIKIKRLVGDAIEKSLATIFYNFYQSTTLKKWGQAYLNFPFFQFIFENMKDRLLLVLAETESGDPLGGSLNFWKGQALYGRYWGAVKPIPFLHFECCYYQLIDFAIEKGLDRVEAGAQGEHKFHRGYEAVPQYSMHYIYNDSGRSAIERFLEEERSWETENITKANMSSPIKAFRN